MKFLIVRGRWPRRWYRWIAVAANGETLCVSEGYVRKADCRHSLDLVKNQAYQAQVDDRS